MIALEKKQIHKTPLKMAANLIECKPKHKIVGQLIEQNVSLDANKMTKERKKKEKTGKKVVMIILEKKRIHNTRHQKAANLIDCHRFYPATPTK